MSLIQNPHPQAKKVGENLTPRVVGMCELLGVAWGGDGQDWN